MLLEKQLGGYDGDPRSGLQFFSAFLSLDFMICHYLSRSLAIYYLSVNQFQHQSSVISIEAVEINCSLNIYHLHTVTPRNFKAIQES